MEAQEREENHVVDTISTSTYWFGLTDKAAMGMTDKWGDTQANKYEPANKHYRRTGLGDGD
jgi:hypothetical protein